MERGDGTPMRDTDQRRRRQMLAEQAIDVFCLL